MRCPVYQIDAFAQGPFTGNPAAVVVLQEWPPDAWLRAVAAENNLTTTAFLIPRGGGYALRWFTPTIEEEICGHATLATAWLVLNVLDPGGRHVVFDTRAGKLRVDRAEDGTLEMDFPARRPEPVVPHPELLPALGGPAPVEILAARDYVVVYENADAVRALRPDFERISRTDRHAVIVTAPGDEDVDCVSRFFAPRHGIPEDPATGAAHMSVAPYWAERLGKTHLRAHQASERGGFFRCNVRGDRVILAGRCNPYLEGTIDA
jgi:PhzF family phenazine biosynthesis protein